MTPRQLVALARVRESRELRADYRAAQIAAAVCEPNRDRSVRSEPFTPFDFMPFLPKHLRDRDETAPVDHSFQIMQMWMYATGGRVIKDAK